MDIIISIILVICGYLYGSIPFALVIGKLIYKTDVRNYGSGNLGGTNVGRVLGKKAGVAVILLDASKALLISLLTGYIASILNLYSDLAYLCGLACVIGHCYPIFANFKGGKAVSTAIGFFFTINPLGAVLALVVFFIVLKITKYVSLSSVLASSSVLLATPFLDISLVGKLTVAAVILLLIYRHRANLKRVKDGTESKITWM
ncbi:glycerol-3-phosphate 1-O-acyltransferase PlsY [Thomasclavelia sp.]|uniref:glycerol-3-phosphate 1-O-acyltransferase PlsY n=1 Tax=Thomasclavelia sp. TaxID=3025757 RepID=UPI0025F9FF94|nr:glycerol-3-phosphate 1-O-acyltransferase PlsY [Thomasclavelia sp.]